MYQRLYEVATIGLEVAAERSGVRWIEPTANLSPVIIATTNTITLTYLSTSDDVAIAKIIELMVTALSAYLIEDCPNGDVEALPDRSVNDPAATTINV